jgi:spoIIIJ-associated protein
MNIDERKQLLEQAVKELLDKMGFQATVYTAVDATSSESSDEAPISVEIQVEDSNYLIGKHGVNLAALQHLARIIVRKRSVERINFTIDVNNYRQDQKLSVIRISQEMAKKTLQDKKAVVLRPMSPYERRLVHIELAKIEGVETESIGEGEDRKVVIRPTSLLD